MKRYTLPNDYTRSLKENTAVELLVQETFRLCSAMHSSVTLLLLLSENWSSQQLNTTTIPACLEGVVCKLGGAGGRFGEDLSVDCANLPCISSRPGICEARFA